MKLAKSQANAKPHPEAELYLIDNYLNSLCTLSSKNTGHFLKNKKKSKRDIYSWGQTVNHNENADESEKSHRYDINRTWLDMNTSILNIKSFSVWWCLYDKQHLKLNSWKS